MKQHICKSQSEFMGYIALMTAGSPGLPNHSNLTPSKRPRKIANRIKRHSRKQNMTSKK